MSGRPGLRRGLRPAARAVPLRPRHPADGRPRPGPERIARRSIADLRHRYAIPADKRVDPVRADVPRGRASRPGAGRRPARLEAAARRPRRRTTSCWSASTRSSARAWSSIASWTGSSPTSPTTRTSTSCSTSPTCSSPTTRASSTSSPCSVGRWSSSHRTSTTTRASGASTSTTGRTCRDRSSRRPRTLAAALRDLDPDAAGSASSPSRRARSTSPTAGRPSASSSDCSCPPSMGRQRPPRRTRDGVTGPAPRPNPLRILRRRLRLAVGVARRQRRRAGPRAESRLAARFSAISTTAPDERTVSVVTVAAAGVGRPWLDAIRAQDPPPREIVVVGPGAEALDAGGIAVRSVAAADGLPAALDVATATLTVLLDPDVRPIGTTWLATLVAALADERHAVGPLLIHGRGRGPVSAGQSWDDLSIASAGIVLDREQGIPWPRHRRQADDGIATVAALSTRALLARTDDLRAVLTGDDTHPRAARPRHRADRRPGPRPPAAGRRPGRDRRDAQRRPAGTERSPWSGRPERSSRSARHRRSGARRSRTSRPGHGCSTRSDRPSTAGRMLAAVRGDQPTIAPPLRVLVRAGPARAAAIVAALQAATPWTVAVHDPAPPPRSAATARSATAGPRPPTHDVVIGDPARSSGGACHGGPIRIAAVAALAAADDRDRGHRPPRRGRPRARRRRGDRGCAARAGRSRAVTVLDPSMREAAGAAVRDRADRLAAGGPGRHPHRRRATGPSAPRWGDLHFGRSLQRRLRDGRLARAGPAPAARGPTTDAARDDADRPPLRHAASRAPSAPRSTSCGRSATRIWPLPELLRRRTTSRTSPRPRSAARMSSELTGRPVAVAAPGHRSARGSAHPTAHRATVRTPSTVRTCSTWPTTGPTDRSSTGCCRPSTTWPSIGQGWEETRGGPAVPRAANAIANRDLAAAYARASHRPQRLVGRHASRRVHPEPRLRRGWPPATFVLSDDVVGLGQVVRAIAVATVYRDGGDPACRHRRDGWPTQRGAPQRRHAARRSCSPATRSSIASRPTPRRCHAASSPRSSAGLGRGWGTIRAAHVHPGARRRPSFACHRIQPPHDLPCQAGRQALIQALVGEPGPPQHPAQPRLRRSSSSPRCVLLLVAIGVTYYNDNLALGRQRRRPVDHPRPSCATASIIENWRLEEAERRIRTQVVAGRHDPGPGGRPGADHRAAGAAARGDRPRAAHRQQASRRTSPTQEGVDRHRCRRRRPPDRGGDDPGGAPRLAHRGRAGDRATGEVEPTPAAIAAAKAKADAALRDLQSGKTWDEVAKTVSTDTSTAPQAGDLGWLNAEDSQADEAFLAARLRRRASTARPTSSRARTASSASAG